MKRNASKEKTGKMKRNASKRYTSVSVGRDTDQPTATPMFSSLCEVNLATLDVKMNMAMLCVTECAH